MSIWLVALLVAIIYALAQVLAQCVWLWFCWRFADKYGVDQLAKLPPLATSFRARQWDLKLSGASGTHPEDQTHSGLATDT